MTIRTADLFAGIRQAQREFAVGGFLTALRGGYIQIQNGAEYVAVSNFLKAGPEVVARIHLTNTVILPVPPLLRVAPEVRAPGDSDLVYVDLALRFLRGLDRDALTGLIRPEILKILHIIHYHLENITARVVGRFLMEGKLSQLALEDMLNPLMHGKFVEFVHINCNATHANKFDNQKGKVGDALLDYTEEWLRDHLRMPVYRTPSGTSFLVICTNLETVRHELQNLSRGVKRRLDNDEALHEHVQRSTGGRANLFDFVPRHVAVGHRLGVKVPSMRDHKLEAFALAELLQALQKATAAASYLEEQGQIDQHLYLLDQIDRPDNAGFKQHLNRRSGWVSYGVYGLAVPSHQGATLSDHELELLRQHPRYRRIVGLVTRSLLASGGGAIERLGQLLQEFATIPETEMDAWLARFTALLESDGTAIGLLGASRVFTGKEESPKLEHLTVLGELSDRVLADPTVYRDFDTFIRASATAEYCDFVFYEHDDFGAFKQRHPETRHDDAHFRRIGGTLDRLMLTKDQPPMRHRYQGDFMIAAHRGDVELTREFHRNVLNDPDYLAHPFQREYKVEVKRRDPETNRTYVDIERIPIWQTTEDPRCYRAARTKPGPKWEPLMGTVKITAVHVRLAPIRTKRQRSDLKVLAERMGTFIDHTAKFATGRAELEIEETGKKVPFPLNKGGLVRFPTDQIPKSLRPA